LSELAKKIFNVIDLALLCNFYNQVMQLS